MAQTNATATANLAEVAQSSTTNAKGTTALVKTQRVLETRSMWDVIFDNVTEMLVAAIKGEALEETSSRKAWGLGIDPESGQKLTLKGSDGKVRQATSADQPHLLAYGESLLVGFVSRKATKIIAKGGNANEQFDTQSLKEIDRNEVYGKVLKALYPKADDAKLAKRLSDVEPKQVFALLKAVTAKL